jgi:putative cell wall-binding protein
MNRPVLSILVTLAATALLLVGLAGSALADHTDPNTPQSQPTEGFTQPFDARGEGEWEHLFNVPPNPGSDHHHFVKDGVLYVVHGTIGQGNENHVGQRILRLMDVGGEFDPEEVAWIADHGSAHCTPGDPAGTLGLQHDQSTVPPVDPEILLDTTDATGRCHDQPSGGIEIIDISGLGEEGFEVREIHLTRFASTTHTLTRDDTYPWLIYSNNSAAGAYWMDFMDIRSCLTESAGGTLPDDADLDTKREQCRPEAYRIPFEQEWTMRTVTLDGEPQGPGNGCHDVTSIGTILYCSGVDGEVILDIAGMVDENGEIQGDPLPCEVIAASPGFDASTGAMVTDCQLGGTHPAPAAELAAWEAAGSPQAEGWEFLGNFNHPGREDNNNNFRVPASEGVAISHQTMPLEIPERFGEFMIVADERGGGVLPHGAACGDPEEDVYWHSGLHVFDITDPGNIQRATMLDEDGEEVNAFWRGEVLQPMPTFCVVHMFHPLHHEQRLVMGYYSQGIKILDYRISEDGHFEFEEVAAFRFPGPVASNTWMADVFHTVDNDDGTRTHFITVSDINRGFDIVSWTGVPGQLQDAPVDRLERVFGPTRIETAVEISRARWDTSLTAVLARDDVFADALAGAALAADEDAPILLTHREELPEATQEEIERLGARRVILLGGDAAISEDVADELRAQAIVVERIGGEDRFETAAMIAEQLGDTETAFLVEGWHANPERGWPDAVSSAPYAAFTENPILLTIHDTLPEATADALEDLGVSETIVVGGSGAVSDAVVSEVSDRGHGPRRVFGPDRYATSVAVLDEAIEAGMDTQVTWLATGENWPDALAAGPAVGLEGDALLLVHDQDLNVSPATRDAIAEHAPTMQLVRLLGGTMAISADVEQQVAGILGEQPADGDHDDNHGDDEEGGGTSAQALLVPLAILPFAALARRRR